MRRAWLWLLLMPHVAHAATLLASWDFPRTYSPQPDRFLLTLASPTVTEEFAVPVSSPSACAAVPGATDNTYCTILPQCPEGGVTQLTIQAQWGSDGTTSDGLVCFYTPLAPCECLPEDTDRPAPPPQPPPTVVPSPPVPTAALPTFPVVPIRAPV
jgi:hypothetical protein